MRWILLTLVVALSTLAVHAESIITPAKILEVRERGLVLTVGTEALIVEDTPQTKFWRDCKAANRDSYQVGQTVHVRIKTDSDPPILREIADSASWDWLATIRKDFVKGNIEKMDAKNLWVKFPDGRTFSYRITDKSDLKLNGKTAPTLADLSAGMQVYVKGRLLPSLDTWVSELSDQAPAAKPAKSTKTGSTPKAPKPKPLPSSGTLEGKSLGDVPTLRMFDMVVGTTALHITYNSDTKFFFEGKAATNTAVKQMLNLRVQYRRDKYGRLVASKVEIFSP